MYASMTTPGANNNIGSGQGVDAARTAAQTAQSNEGSGLGRKSITKRHAGGKGRRALNAAGKQMGVAYKHTVGKGVKLAKAAASSAAKKVEKKKSNYWALKQFLTFMYEVWKAKIYEAKIERSERFDDYPAYLKYRERAQEIYKEKIESYEDKENQRDLSTEEIKALGKEWKEMREELKQLRKAAMPDIKRLMDEAYTLKDFGFFKNSRPSANPQSPASPKEEQAFREMLSKWDSQLKSAHNLNLNKSEKAELKETIEAFGDLLKEKEGITSEGIQFLSKQLEEAGQALFSKTPPKTPPKPEHLGKPKASRPLPQTPEQGRKALRPVTSQPQGAVAPQESELQQAFKKRGLGDN